MIKLKNLINEAKRWEIGPEEEIMGDIFDDKAPEDLQDKVWDLFDMNMADKAWDIILKWAEKNVTRKDIKNYY